MQTTISKAKDTNISLSEQVKSILQLHGLSKVFNYSDYWYFKSKTKKSFNRAQDIANLFIAENEAESDFNDYIF
jgi:hypothetical protein